MCRRFKYKRHVPTTRFTVEMWDRMVEERLARRAAREREQLLHANGKCAGPLDEFRAILSRAEGTPIPQLTAQAERDKADEAASMLEYPMKGVA